jgi:hypothetical protein
VIEVLKSHTVAGWVPREDDIVTMARGKAKAKAESRAILGTGLGEQRVSRMETLV